METFQVKPTFEALVLILERGRESHWCEKETSISCLLYKPQPGIESKNLGMCPNEESNLPPFCAWMMPQPTDQHQPEPLEYLLNLFLVFFLYPPSYLFLPSFYPLSPLRPAVFLFFSTFLSSFVPLFYLIFNFLEKDLNSKDIHSEDHIYSIHFYFISLKGSFLLDIW